MSGTITLGQVAAPFDASRHMLAVFCNRCERRGRLRLDHNLAEHWP
jgi:hypothetical protein